jgi:membrane protein DedA with SNARE-associated domain
VEHYLHYFIDHFGYIGIMIVLMLGIVGMPIPDELLLTYIGYRISTGSMSYPIAFVFSFIGAIAGISISYYLRSKTRIAVFAENRSKNTYYRKANRANESIICQTRAIVVVYLLFYPWHPASRRIFSWL